MLRLSLAQISAHLLSGFPSGGTVLPRDVSTGRPTSSSASCYSTDNKTPNDGKSSPYALNWHSCKVDRDPWWGVHLESKVTNPQVTITSRSCCAADYGNSMNVYIIDKKWPGSNGGFPPPNGVAIRTHKSGAKKPFDECGGDCDHDSDCRGDLVCFQRSGSTANAPIPGCSGSATGTQRSGSWRG